MLRPTSLRFKRLSGNVEGSRNPHVGRRVPWKTGMLLCHLATSRPLIFQQKEAVLSPCNFALVAQCSATPATVPATPPCSATPFQTQISVRHLRDTKIFRCRATPGLLHLQNALKSRKSAATRVARQGAPAIMCNSELRDHPFDSFHLAFFISL